MASGDTRGPLPAACGQGTPDELTTAACSAAMAKVCAVATDDGGQARCAMLNPSSRCFDWKNAIEAAIVQQETGKTSCAQKNLQTVQDECKACTKPSAKYALNAVTVFSTQEDCLQDASNNATPQGKASCQGFTWSDDTAEGEFTQVCSTGDAPYTDPVTLGVSCHTAKPCWDTKCADPVDYAESQCKGDHTVEGAASFDSAVRQYCDNDGFGSLECKCMNFPTLASSWCERGQQSCRPDVLMPGADQQDVDESCYAREFVQQNPDGTGFTAIQFSGCNPLPCWYSACRASPGQRVVTTHMLKTQLTGCASVCMQTVNDLSLEFPNLASPLPADANIAGEVDAEVIQKCGAGGNVASACVVMNNPTVSLASNQKLSAPYTIDNNGDLGAVVSIKVSQPWLIPSQTQIFVPARGSVPLTMNWDATKVNQAGSTYTATVSLSYASSGQACTNPFVTTLALRLLDPLPPVRFVEKVFPSSFKIALYSLVGVSAAMLVGAGIAEFYSSRKKQAAA